MADKGGALLNNDSVLWSLVHREAYLDMSHTTTQHTHSLLRVTNDERRSAGPWICDCGKSVYE